MSKSKLEILEAFRNINFKELENIPLSEAYWKADAELCRKLHQKSKELQDSLKMSDEKFRKPFDL